VKNFRAPLLRIRQFPAGVVLLGCFGVLWYALPSHALMQKTPAPGAAAAKSPSPLDPAAFAAEMRAIEAKVLGGNGTPEEIDAIRHGLPASWKVRTAESEYEISSEPLRNLLVRASGDAANRKEILEEAGVWAENAATQAESYTVAEATQPSADLAPRAKLDQVLKRHEFSPPSPPTPWQLLRERISKWLLKMFGKLFASIARHPLGSEILFWLVIFGVACFLVTMLVQFWMRRGRNIALASIGTIAAHRSWQEWIRAAQEAALRGEFREAIHSLYWVGITRLEDLSILTVDHTRTPREQLRLLSGAPGATAAATAEQRARMAGLTTQLERVWYGRRPASVEDFRECLKYVEDLGCHAA
jgi:hypothetical protein